MSGSLIDIRRLLPVLEMSYQAEQMKMAKIIQRIQGLRNQLLALERPVQPPSDTLSASTIAGADLRWEQWAHERKGLINQELAIALRDRENAKSDLLLALSKLEAARQMEARAKFENRRTIERRSSW